MVTRRERVVLELDDRFTPGMLRAAAAAKLLKGEVDDTRGSFDPLGRSASDLDRKLERISRSSTSAGRGFDDLDRSARRAERSGSLLGDAVVGLGPALLPVGAIAVPAVAGLAAQLGFAAAAGGSALLAFNGVGTALKTLDAYNLDPTAANLQKMQEAMDKLGPAGQEFVRQLNRLEPSLKQLKVASEDGLLPGVGDGIDALLTRLPQVRRIISEVSETSGDLVREAGEGLAGQRFDGFFDYLEHDAKPILTDLGHTLGEVTLGFANLFTATAPGQREFSSWLVSVARDFEHWTAGLEGSQGLQDFMDYLHETGPEVAHALGSIANAVLQVTEAAGPLGCPTLQALSAVADVIARIAASPVGTPLVALASGLALLNRALVTRDVARGSTLGQLISGRTDRIERARTSLRGLRADMKAANSFGALGGFAGAKALGSSAELERQAAAAGRLRGQLGGLGKGAALVGGLTFATSGLADKMHLANTASYALLGTIAGPWGAAIGGGIGLATDFAHANDDMRDAIKAADRALGSNSQSGLRNLKTQRAILRGQLSQNSKDLKSGNPLDRPKAAIADILGITGQAKNKVDEIDQAIALLHDRATGRVAGVGAVLTGGLGGPLAQVGADFDRATAASNLFYDSLNRYSARLDIRSALREQSQAIIDFRRELDQQPVGKGGTEGRVNREAALDRYAQAALNVANQTRNVDTQTRRLAASRKVFVGMAHDIGLSRPEARKLATQLGLVDRTAAGAGASGRNAGRNVAGGMNAAGGAANRARGAARGFGGYLDSLAGKRVSPKITADTSGARREVSSFMAYLNGINGKVVHTSVVTNHVDRKAKSGGAALGSLLDPTKKAAGGWIHGPGGPRDDLVPAWLSNGEFVVNAASASKYHAQLEAMNAQHFANGGGVQRATAPTVVHVHHSSQMPTAFKLVGGKLNIEGDYATLDDAHLIAADHARNAVADEREMAESMRVARQGRTNSPVPNWYL